MYEPITYNIFVAEHSLQTACLLSFKALDHRIVCVNVPDEGLSIEFTQR